MKKIILLSLTAISLLSCSEDDTPNNNPTSISGSYSLVKLSGGFAGHNNNFDAGSITWTINEGNNTVTVVNNYNDNNGTVEDFLETGTYSFLQDTATPANQCTATFKADGMDLGCFTQAEDGTITFNQQYADGYLLTLEPIQ